MVQNSLKQKTSDRACYIISPNNSPSASRCGDGAAFGCMRGRHRSLRRPAFLHILLAHLSCRGRRGCLELLVIGRAHLDLGRPFLLVLGLVHAGVTGEHREEGRAVPGGQQEWWDRRLRGRLACLYYNIPSLYGPKRFCIPDPSGLSGAHSSLAQAQRFRHSSRARALLRKGSLLTALRCS